MLGDKGMIDVSNFLDDNQQIEYLSLRNNNIQSTGLNNLLKNKEYGQLWCLDLEFNKIGYDGGGGLERLKEGGM